jgi:hypothetical protein
VRWEINCTQSKKKKIATDQTFHSSQGIVVLVVDVDGEGERWRAARR